MAWYNPTTWNKPSKVETAEPVQKINKTTIPPGRATRPTFGIDAFVDIKSRVTFVNPGYIAEYIPIIRKLSWVNPDVGVAVNDMVQLTNTGHRIKFDPATPADQQEKMKRHLEEKQEQWGDGVSRMHGLINKMVAQTWISGALANEWVPSNDLKGINHLALVNPETIRFQWNKKKLRFLPYQKQDTNTGGVLGERYVKLNTNTFKYFGLNGDTDIPYGIPPFLTAMSPLTTQSEMDKNIKYIMRQVGLMGFTQLLMEKPGQQAGESDAAYETRLVKVLVEAKNNVMDGITDGTVVGYKDDHEFTFESTTKNLVGVSDIYNQNEVQVANGLKMAPQFLGVGGSGAETGINIIFTKMLSQLQNVQKLVAANLKYGYVLELKLAGFNFKSLHVEFEPSTITDELKFQQSQEYKIRNTENKYLMGVISQQQKADELGYDKPAEPASLAPPNEEGAQKEKRQDQNDKSDKGTRDKAKPQPKKGGQKAIAEQLINAIIDLMTEDK